MVYPQNYGKPDKNAKGSAKDGTWAGLAEEVRYWGNWVLDKVRAEIGDLYPPIPDPKAPKIRQILGKAQLEMTGKGFEIAGQQKLAVETPAGFLTPVAYLWTRTVQCKKPSCRASVPLVKQTWLRKKNGRYVAMKVVAMAGKKTVRFEVVEGQTEHDLGFDPTAFSKAGNATCKLCGTVADSDYVMAEGCAGRIGTSLMAVVCSRPGAKGKVYLSANEIPNVMPDEVEIKKRIEKISHETGVTVPDESISPTRPSPNARGLSGLTRYGVSGFGSLFLSRQQLLLLTICEAAIRASEQSTYGDAVACYLGLLVGRVANQNCAFGVYNTIGEKIEGPMGDKKVPMVWDFPETNPFSGLTGGMDNAIGWIVDVLGVLSNDTPAGQVQRGDATVARYLTNHFDAIITDPPYYDNVPYADISDFFYVWLKRVILRRFPEHFTSALSPKKSELTALSSKFDGDMKKATESYETGMLAAFKEANRILKESGIIAVIYAHKTTLGWATLLNALRCAGFEVTEAWPLKTEMPAGKVKIDKAMLASSIFLIARKRDSSSTVGNYEASVVPELEMIVRGRVETLWEMGISGADLVIACVGAGLRAFTKYARVEYSNGEEVPAERFLAEVETVVLETILGKLSKVVGAKNDQTSLAGLDPATRFYVLWRYTYGIVELDAGEAIIFANGTHVELNGASGLSGGTRALVAKNKSKYRLLDYTERGDDAKLGMPSDDGQPSSLVDALHRLLWLVERHPSSIPDFLREARPNTEQMRLVAQALAGPALKGGELGEVASGSELAALTKLTANWRSVVDDAAGEAAGPLFKTSRQRE